ncbi:phasin family protein [Novosphingobium mangrovi (ex Huang et al. 2023)]|uniref:Phasin family protein n=1 Tax=Novosphingobium mangrovi (ex Huang et al. 2023) TaxID=2976432 RepID=A0ABT2HZL3_9SPHN|nr:phasin family protein [Novosphingobium mangrovi (ex Huang et al. 2023)]MCT2397989.1 phasin family protein [Novosphingobium mangrovi (ex Huang et al. 2023)]
MAANEDPKDIAGADKAYQAAVEAVPEKPVAAAPAAKVAKGKAAAPKALSKTRAAKAKPAPVKAEAAPEAPAPAPVKAVAKAKPAAKAPAAKTVAKAKPVSKPASTPAKKVVPVKAAAKPAVKVVKEMPAPAAASPKAAKPKAAKTASEPAFAGLFTNFMLEDTKMDMSANFSGLQDVMTEAQTKAKDAFEKSTKMLGEVGDFTKGNVEAVMESGKILAEGVQSMGSEIVSEGRSAFETMTGDIKELAAAKSPTDYFKIQSDMMRKNFDSAVAYGSKNSEAMLKLVSDAIAPISGRVSMAMEKVRSASL